MNQSSHVICPSCTAVNRLEHARLIDKPACGKCHEPLFSGHPVELTQHNFQKTITRNDIPVVVDFWAPWCGPCKMMAPAFQEAAKRLEPYTRLAKINTEDEPGIASQFQIRSIPTLVVFHNGREVARQPGAMNAADIVRWVQSVL